MTTMIKKRVAELEGAQLDWAVARALGWRATRTECGLTCCHMVGEVLHVESMDFRPSAEWSDGGPIIERERIGLATQRTEDGAHWEWLACSHGYAGVHPLECTHIAGPTPLIAAMRAFIASKLGDEVEVPE